MLNKRNYTETTNSRRRINRHRIILDAERQKKETLKKEINNVVEKICAIVGI